MPWNGIDTLSGVSQQSLMKGYDNGYNSYNEYNVYDTYDGYSGPGDFDDSRSAGFDDSRLIPSAWEDVCGHASLLSSRMFSQIHTRGHGQGHGQARHPRNQTASRNAFSSYEFAHRAPSRDPSLDNIFAEFSEKCSVGDRRCDGSSRWMDTPTRHSVGGQDAVKDNVHPAPVERSRRRLNF